MSAPGNYFHNKSDIPSIFPTLPPCGEASSLVIERYYRMPSMGLAGSKRFLYVRVSKHPAPPSLFFAGEVENPGRGMLTGIKLGGLLQILLVMQFCQEINHLSLNVAHDFKGWLHPWVWFLQYFGANFIFFCQRNAAPLCHRSRGATRLECVENSFWGGPIKCVTPDTPDFVWTRRSSSVWIFCNGAADQSLH